MRTVRLDDLVREDFHIYSSGNLLPFRRLQPRGLKQNYLAGIGVQRDGYFAKWRLKTNVSMYVEGKSVLFFLTYA